MWQCPACDSNADPRGKSPVGCCYHSRAGVRGAGVEPAQPEGGWVTAT